MKQLLPIMLISLFTFQGAVVAHNGGGSEIIGQQPKVQPNWDVKIYPNPNNGVFSVMVTGSSAPLDVMVFNVIGEKVFELRILGDHGAKIDLSGLQKGLYVIQIVDRNRSEVITRRMHIE